MKHRVGRAPGPPCGSILRVAAAALISAAPSLVRAQPPDKACSLLTDAEITAAIAAPSRSRENQMPLTQGPAKGETMRVCSWSLPNGAVNLSFVKVADLEAARSAFRARMDQTIQALKSQGWTIEEKAFGSDTNCWIGTPPTGANDLPRTTGCVGATHGLGISVGATGSSRVEVDVVKKLLDAAMSRIS